jgi:hypothetical protein
LIVYVAYNSCCRDGHIFHSHAAFEAFVDSLASVVGWVFSVMRAPSPFGTKPERWRGRAGFSFLQEARA